MRKLLVLFFVLFGIVSCSTHQASTVSKVSPSVVQEESNAKSDPNYHTIEIGSTPFSPLAYDFNQDGLVDIAAVSHGDNLMMILWGKGDRKFVRGPIYGKADVGYHPGKIVLVDWNRDGLKDIIITNEGLSAVQYWENTGKGFIKKATVSVPINGTSIQCADLDNDGFLDIVLGPHQADFVTILWGKKGLFSFDVQKIKSNDMVQNVEIGDWNNDGHLDIFWVEMMPGSVVVALNQGKRNFVKQYIKRPGKAVGLVKDGPIYVKLADLNGDGCQDAAVTLEVGKGCKIFYGDCKGGIKMTEMIEAPEWGFSGLAAVGRGPNHVPMLALGEEQRLFIAKKIQQSWRLTEKPAGSLPRDFTFVDIDKDGALDLIFANMAGNSIGIIYGPF